MNSAIWILGPDSDPISYYTRDPQADLNFAAAWAIATFALLTTDGQWIDADQPGPFSRSLPGEEVMKVRVKHRRQLGKLLLVAERFEKRLLVELNAPRLATLNKADLDRVFLQS